MVKPLSARQHELSSGRGWETILPDMGLRHSSSLLAPHTETRPGLTILPATSLMPWKELKCETKLFAHTAPMRQEPSGRPALPVAGSQKCHPESIQGSNSGPPLVLYWPKICPLSTGLFKVRALSCHTPSPPKAPVALVSPMWSLPQCLTLTCLALHPLSNSVHRLPWSHPTS